MDPITVTKDDVDKVVKTIRELSRTTVVVGIPEEENDRKSTPGTKTVSNSMLGYIHEFGSPLQNIPARAWLVPGVEAAKDKWTNYLNQAAKLAFEGNPAASDRAFNAAGLTAMSSVKNRMSAGIPPPLAPATMAARMRSHGATKTGTAALPPMFSGFTPLIDTAQMLSSITYAVRKAKK